MSQGRINTNHINSPIHFHIPNSRIPSHLINKRTINQQSNQTATTVQSNNSSSTQYLASNSKSSSTTRTHRRMTSRLLTRRTVDDNTSSSSAVKNVKLAPVVPLSHSPPARSPTTTPFKRHQVRRTCHSNIQQQQHFHTTNAHFHHSFIQCASLQSSRRNSLTVPSDSRRSSLSSVSHNTMDDSTMSIDHEINNLHIQSTESTPKHIFIQQHQQQQQEQRSHYQLQQHYRKKVEKLNQHFDFKVIPHVPSSTDIETDTSISTTASTESMLSISPLKDELEKDPSATHCKPTDKDFHCRYKVEQRQQDMGQRVDQHTDSHLLDQVEKETAVLMMTNDSPLFNAALQSHSDASIHHNINTSIPSVCPQLTHINRDALVSVLACILEQLFGQNSASYAKQQHLHSNDKSQRPAAQMTVFHSDRIPSISITDYLHRIAQYSESSAESLIMSLIHISRIEHNFNAVVHVSPYSIHRLLLTSVLVTSKYFDDNYYNNHFYSRIGGISLQEINRLEIEFLSIIHYELYIQPKVFETFLQELSNPQLHPKCQCMHEELEKHFRQTQHNTTQTEQKHK